MEYWPRCLIYYGSVQGLANFNFFSCRGILFPKGTYVILPYDYSLTEKGYEEDPHGIGFLWTT